MTRSHQLRLAGSFGSPPVGRVPAERPPGPARPSSVGNTIRTSWAFGTIAALGIVTVLAGCGENAGSGVGPQGTAPSATAKPSSRTPSPQSSSTSTPATSVPAELTAEESLRVTPPAPRALRASPAQGTVELSWEPPPPVTTPHTYGDRVVHYRVFRAVGSGAFALVGTTSSLRFSDPSVPAGSTVRYAVSDVRDHGIESSWTDSVSVTVP